MEQVWENISKDSQYVFQSFTMATQHAVCQDIAFSHSDSFYKQYLCVCMHLNVLGVPVSNGL